MKDGHHLDPHRALRETERIGQEVRRRARWHGFAWLAVGLLTPPFLIAIGTDAFPREAAFWFAIVFMLVGGTLAIWESRRGVTSRATAAVDRPATWAYVAAMVGVAAVILMVDITGTPGWFVALAMVPAIPALVAARRILAR